MTIETVPCGLCDLTTRADNLCHGCGKVICDVHPEAPFGPHDADDHRECSVCGEVGHFDGECPDLGE